MGPRFAGPGWGRRDWFGGPGFGHGPMGGPPPWRTRRGETRGQLLTALKDGPAHGYELITRLEERSGGRWRPGPGSVYPTLQMLEKEGLLTSAMVEGKRVYSLTDAGRAEADAPLDHDGRGPSSDGPAGALRASLGKLAAASMQIGQSGEQKAIDAAVAIVDDARKKLYQILAES